MKVIDFKLEDHYSIVSKWWDLHKNWEPVHPNLLPPIGFIVGDDLDYYCAGWLYQGVETPVSWFEWVVSNPKSDKFKRSKALDLLIDHVTNYADTLGIAIIFHATKGQAWMHRLNKKNFNTVEKLNLMIRSREV